MLEVIRLKDSQLNQETYDARPTVEFRLVFVSVTQVTFARCHISSICSRDRRCVIPPSHRRHGATMVFGQNRHHRSDNASSFTAIIGDRTAVLAAALRGE